MEITIEEFRQEIDRLDHKIELEIAGVKEDFGQKIADAQVKIIQWMAGIFIGSTVLVGTIIGVYLAVLLALR